MRIIHRMRKGCGLNNLKEWIEFARKQKIKTNPVLLIYFLELLSAGFMSSDDGKTHIILLQMAALISQV